MARGSNEPWVVWSNEHRQWWGSDHRGYSPNLLHAGIYTQEEAEHIAREARTHLKGQKEPPEVAMSLVDALRKAQMGYREGDRVVGTFLNALADVRKGVGTKKPVCVTCEKEMVRVVNGVYVQMNAKSCARPGDLQGPYQLWLGDLFRCQSCGHDVIAAFGDAPVWEHHHGEQARTAMLGENMMATAVVPE